jgi:hypothetical protein
MIELDKKLHKEIKEYCQLNGLVMKEYVNSLLKKAFTADKFGETPFSSCTEESLKIIHSPYTPVAESKPIKTSENNKKLVENKFITTEISSEITQTLPTKEEDKIVFAPYTTEDTVTSEPIETEKHKQTKTVKKPKKRNL